MNASDQTAQGLYDILSHQNLRPVNDPNLLLYSRELSPCLSPVAAMPHHYGFNSAVLSHGAIPLASETHHDFSSLNLQPQFSSKNQTFGRQAQLSQKFRAS